jgi:SAM-dependent methyltransferase
VTIRSGTKLILNSCSSCDFDFFGSDPSADLADDKLDGSRLASAGLSVPAREEDFANGLAQSAELVSTYLDASDVGANVLEIGCSWGYFLKLVDDLGAVPYGVELNAVRRESVKSDLGIDCYASIDEAKSVGTKFRKIFLFYVIEYIPDPVTYLKELRDLLAPGGEVIIITPNKHDPLRDIWSNPGFESFFFDEYSVGYHSLSSLQVLLERASAQATELATRQGYSLANHLRWHFTNAPLASGIVGGDDLTASITEVLTSQGSPREQASTCNAIARLIEQADSSYRRLLEESQLGNQLHLRFGFEST